MSLLLFLISLMAVNGTSVPKSPRTALRFVSSGISASYLLLAGNYLQTSLVYGEKEDKLDKRLHQELFKSFVKPKDKVLEIGIGAQTKNLASGYYPSGIHLTGIDLKLPPSSLDKTELEKNHGISIDSLTESNMETIPFADQTFDVVVGTLVLCSVDDQDQALREISRVLKPDGVYIGVEHVLQHEEESESAGNIVNSLRKQQLLFNDLQVRMADNCHLNRRTDELLRSATTSDAGLFKSVDLMDYHEFVSMWPINSQVSFALRK